MHLLLTPKGLAALDNNPNEFTVLQVNIMCRCVKSIAWPALLEDLRNIPIYAGITPRNMANYVANLVDRHLLAAERSKAARDFNSRSLVTTKHEGELFALPHPPTAEAREAFIAECILADVGYKTAEECKAYSGTVNRKMLCLACGEVFYEHKRIDVLRCPFCLKSHFMALTH